MIQFDGPHPAYSETKRYSWRISCHRKTGGVYFWAIKVNDSFRITHIGQTGTSVLPTDEGTHHQHAPAAIIASPIPTHWDAAKRNPLGRLWREGHRERLPEFLRDSTKLLGSGQTQSEDGENFRRSA